MGCRVCGCLYKYNINLSRRLFASILWLLYRYQPSIYLNTFTLRNVDNSATSAKICVGYGLSNSCSQKHKQSQSPQLCIVVHYTCIQYILYIYCMYNIDNCLLRWQVDESEAFSIYYKPMWNEQNTTETREKKIHKYFVLDKQTRAHTHTHMHSNRIQPASQLET